MNLEKTCFTCDSFITVRMHTNNNGLCDHCFATSVKPTLKLFEAELEPDDSIGKQGFYVVLLAVDLESAKAFAQKQFNIEYEGVIDVYQDDVQFSEIEGPFPAGKVLVSLHY